MDTRPELLLKLYSLINRYGGIENFVSHMDEWPRTIRRLIEGSEELKIELGLVCLLPEQDEEGLMGME